MHVPTSIEGKRAWSRDSDRQRIVSAKIHINVLAWIFTADSWHRWRSTSNCEVIVWTNSVSSWLSEWKIDEINLQLANVTAWSWNHDVTPRASTKHGRVSIIDEVSVVGWRCASTSLRHYNYWGLLSFLSFQFFSWLTYTARCLSCIRLTACACPCHRSTKSITLSFEQASPNERVSANAYVIWKSPECVKRENWWS